MSEDKEVELTGGERLTLKWGTLKAWHFKEGGKAFEAFKRYHDEPVALGAAQQHDTDAQKQALCDIIDALDCNLIYLDWDGKYVTKDEAKEYVANYGKARSQ